MLATLDLGRTIYEYHNRIRDVSFSEGFFDKIVTDITVNIKNDVIETIDLSIENPYRFNYLKLTANGIVLPFYYYYIIDVKEIASDKNVYRLYLAPDVFSKGLYAYIDKIHITKSKNKSLLHAPYQFTPIKQLKDIVSYYKIESILDGVLKNSYLFFFAFTVNEGTVTTMKYGCQLVFNAGQPDVLQFNENGNIVDSGVSTIFIQDLFNGDWDEKLGLSPSQIKGAWLVKLPFNCVKVGNQVKLRIDGYKDSDLVTHQYGDIIHGYAIIRNPEKWLLSFTFVEPIQSDDFNNYVFTDEYENIVYTIPKNYVISNVTYRLNFGVTALTIDAILNSDANGNYVSNDNKFGLKFSKNACSIPIGSNAWSDYVNSGQRDYELQLAHTNREFQKNQAIAGSVSNTIGGAIAGASTGNPYMALGGAIGGLTGSLVTAFWTDSENRKLDNALQRLKDKNVQGQFSEIISSNDQINKAYTNFEFCLMRLTMSNEEQNNRLEEIKRNGYDVDISLSGTTDIFNYFSDTEGIVKCDNIIIKDLYLPNKYIEEIKNYFMTGFYNRVI